MIVVDELRCQGWWNILINRKKKFFFKKIFLLRFVNEFFFNELDFMVRWNKQRIVNVIEKFEIGLKENVKVDNQVKVFVKDMNVLMNIMEFKVVFKV